MVPRTTAALALLAVALVAAPAGCQGGFFDLLGRKDDSRKKDAVAPAVNTSADAGNLKPTIEFKVLPPDPPQNPKRRGKPLRALPALRDVTPEAAAVPAAPETADAAKGPIPPAEPPAPDNAPESSVKAPEASANFKSGQENAGNPTQTVLKNMIKKTDDNNIVATIDIPAGQVPVISDGSSAVASQSNSQPAGLPSQGINYYPFVQDPSNPAVAYGPYPSELGYKPFGFFPQYPHSPGYGIGNVMEMGPHPWWHPYVRRRRMWYDYPPQSPWHAPQVQYMPMTPVWSRQRFARESLPLEMEIYGIDDTVRDVPQSYMPYSSSYNPYYQPYLSPYTYPFGSMYPYIHPSQRYSGYPWQQAPLLAPPTVEYLGAEAVAEQPSDVIHNDQESASRDAQRGGAQLPPPHLRHQKHRHATRPSWQLPQVQPPKPIHSQENTGSPQGGFSYGGFPYESPQVLNPYGGNPYVGSLYSASPYGGNYGNPPYSYGHPAFFQHPGADVEPATQQRTGFEGAAAVAQGPATLQAPAMAPEPLTPPPPPPPPPPPSGGDVPYHKV